LAEQIWSRMDRFSNIEGPRQAHVASNLDDVEGPRPAHVPENLDALRVSMDETRKEFVVTFELLQQEMKAMHQAFDKLSERTGDRIDQLTKVEQPRWVNLLEYLDELHTSIDETKRHSVAQSEHFDQDVKAVRKDMGQAFDTLAELAMSRKDKLISAEVPGRIDMSENLGELHASMDETRRECISTFDHLDQEVKAMKLAWTTAHSAQMQDIRKLVEDLRQDLAFEVKNRIHAEQTLSRNLLELDAFVNDGPKEGKSLQLWSSTRPGDDPMNELMSREAWKI